MTIIPPAVLTATQLVSGLVASAKNARDLAKDSSNHDLKATVSELYDSLIDVKARVLELDEENRSLKIELAKKDEIVGPDDKMGYFYRKDKPDQPLCPKFYQSSPSRIVFLSRVKDLAWFGTGRHCIVCGETYTEIGASNKQGPRTNLRMS